MISHSFTSLQPYLRPRTGVDGFRRQRKGKYGRRMSGDGSSTKKLLSEGKQYLATVEKNYRAKS